MARSKLVLLDANVVIHLFEQGVWDRVVERYEIHLAQTVVEEAGFFETAEGDRYEIALTPDIEGGRISVFSLCPSDLDGFLGRFDATYFERLHDGEAESLAYLMRLDDDEGALLCSADRIVFRVLGNLHMGDAGLSLEELLEQVGLGRRLSRQYTKRFREEATRKGSREAIRGMGAEGDTEP